jgi:hypothetical protein
VGLLSGVDKSVNGESRNICKILVTELTVDGLLGFPLVNCFGVPFKMTPIEVALVTSSLRAEEPFSMRVHQSMILQVRRVPKALVTLVTFEGPLERVNRCDVTPEMNVLCKGLVTEGAFVRLFSSMDP